MKRCLIGFLILAMTLMMVGCSYEDTPKLTATPKPTATSKPTAIPTPKPTASPKPTATPKSTASYSKDMEKARSAAYSYIEKLEAKQRNISFVSLSSGGRCSGDYYYIDCTVHFKDYSTRKGTIKILKNTSGSFEALGLDFH